MRQSLQLYPCCNLIRNPQVGENVLQLESPSLSFARSFCVIYHFPYAITLLKRLNFLPQKAKYTAIFFLDFRVRKGCVIFWLDLSDNFPLLLALKYELRSLRRGPTEKQSKAIASQNPTGENLGKHSDYQLRRAFSEITKGAKYFRNESGSSFQVDSNCPLVMKSSPTVQQHVINVHQSNVNYKIFTSFRFKILWHSMPELDWLV